jgi:hypothetical protein
MIKRQQNMDYSKLPKLSSLIFVRIINKFLNKGSVDVIIKAVCVDLVEKRHYVSKAYMCTDYCNEAEKQLKKFGAKVRIVYGKSNNHAWMQAWNGYGWIDFDPQHGVKCFEKSYSYNDSTERWAYDFQKYNKK